MHPNLSHLKKRRYMKTRLGLDPSAPRNIIALLATKINQFASTPIKQASWKDSSHSLLERWPKHKIS